MAPEQRTRQMAKERRASSEGGQRLRVVREQAVLAEVRGLLSRDKGLSRRLRRLESMEHAARIWVNGKALGPQTGHDHLSETYD
jgi:hypothetical protein